MSSHKIAVIITTYNNKAYLLRVLNSYLKQTRLPDEIIVADDGSSDGTYEMVSDFTAHAGISVKYVWQEDNGFRAARIRNEAAKASESDYLIYTDGDCLPHPEFISDHEKLITPGFFIQGKRMIISKETSADFEYKNSFDLLLKSITGKSNGLHHIIRIPGYAKRKDGIKGIKTCNFALFKSDLYAVNGFNEDFTGWGREDSELAVRLLKSGLKRKDPPFSALVFHLWHNENERQSLASNDKILNDTINSPNIQCKNGIEC